MNSESGNPRVVRVADLTNAEFLRRHARAGCVGLAGGRTLVDAAIGRAQRHLNRAHRWSPWSHAFFFEGERVDGHHWVIESDLQFHHKHIQLGVQENRLAKYHDQALYTRLAVLDFGLIPVQTDALVREGLDLVATHTGYSLRELVGTLIALRHQTLRGKTNLMARDRAIFCSAMVRHIFDKAGVDLAPGVTVKNTTPDDLARSLLLRTTYLLDRSDSSPALETVHRKLRAAKAKWRRVGKRLLRDGRNEDG